MKESVEIEDDQSARVLFGPGDCNLRLIRDHLEIKVVARNGNIILEGNDGAVQRGCNVVKELVRIVRDKGALRRETVTRTIERFTPESEDELTEKIEVFNRSVVISCNECN